MILLLKSTWMQLEHTGKFGWMDFCSFRCQFIGAFQVLLSHVFQIANSWGVHHKTKILYSSINFHCLIFASSKETIGSRFVWSWLNCFFKCWKLRIKLIILSQRLIQNCLISDRRWKWPSILDFSITNKLQKMLRECSWFFHMRYFKNPNRHLFAPNTNFTKHDKLYIH